MPGPKIDKESICTPNSLDITTEIKNLHCFGLITYKNSEKSDNIGAMVEMDGEKNKHYPQWTTTSERVKLGTARPITNITMVWTGNTLFISFLFSESDKKA